VSTGIGDPAVYCAMANAGYDFTWSEMQHAPSSWDWLARAWRSCPNAKAVPGVRVAYTDEREIQHALDTGALVLVVPTVDTVEEAREVVHWAMFPPLGGRSLGGGPAFDPNMWGNVPGGYRNTINDNLVIIVMIETLEGLKNADEIAKVPGISAVFAASSDLGISPATNRAIRITSGRSTSCMTPQSKPASAVRPLRVEGPCRFHLLPGGQRIRGDCARRQGRARRFGGHAGQTGSGALRECAITSNRRR
jgi:hypothetical protein